jgi:hypothetical protein
MGLFGALGSFAGAVVKTATFPLDVVKDTVTMGGTLNDENEPSTLRKLKSISRSIDKIGDDLDE